MRSESTRDPTAVRDFEREIDILRTSRHPRGVDKFSPRASSPSRGVVALVAELVDGGSLHDALRGEGVNGQRGRARAVGGPARRLRGHGLLASSEDAESGAPRLEAAEYSVVVRPRPVSRARRSRTLASRARRRTRTCARRVTRSGRSRTWPRSCSTAAAGATTGAAAAAAAAGGGGGETASHTTPFAWCTPFLKDFSRRHSSPALPFQRLTGKTFD